jgi:hypothetical protein
MQPLEIDVTIVERTFANMDRRKKRDEIATEGNLDQKASELHDEVKSWANVARQLGYANGAVARRAAMRYRVKNNLV